MNKYNFQTYIDFGASKIRIGVFDYELPKNNLYNQIECISNFDKEKLNIDTSKNLINKLIQSSEKELNLHIKNITLMIDAPDVQSFDFSIKKNLDSKSSFFDDIKFLLQDARQLAQKKADMLALIYSLFSCCSNKAIGGPPIEVLVPINPDKNPAENKEPVLGFNFKLGCFITKLLFKKYYLN